MKRDTRLILIILGILVTAIALLAAIDRRDAGMRRVLQENKQFVLKLDGETAAVIGLQDLLDMQPETFTAPLATSITRPRNTILQGVELRHICERFAIDTSVAAAFIIRGMDGYYSVLTPAEVSEEATIYICVTMDGALLEDKSSGGWGPFLMVVRGAAFAQRWCKYVEEVDIR